jgi:hypothetical protein avisC_03927
MPARRRIDPAAGALAVRRWAAAGDPAVGGTPGPGDGAGGPEGKNGEGTEGAKATEGVGRAGALDRRTLATAVRFALEELAACAPGRAVEVRVPPYGVTQAVAGTVHRRGTPPSVVETDAETWLALVTGRLTWADAVAGGALRASGERCDLSAYLPLLRT